MDNSNNPTAPTNLPYRVDEFLCSFVGDIANLPAEQIDAVRARIFGQLVKLAAPHVDHYHSDFYRDVQSLQAMYTDGGEFEFAYSFNDCGTWLTSMATSKLMSRDNQYHCRIQCESSDYSRRWTFTAELVVS